MYSNIISFAMNSSLEEPSESSEDGDLDKQDWDSLDYWLHNEDDCPDNITLEVESDYSSGIQYSSENILESPDDSEITLDSQVTSDVILDIPDYSLDRCSEDDTLDNSIGGRVIIFEVDGEPYAIPHMSSMMLSVAFYSCEEGFRDIFPYYITRQIDAWVVMMVETLSEEFEDAQDEETGFPGSFIFLIMEFVRISDVVADDDRIEFGSWHASDAEL